MPASGPCPKCGADDWYYPATHSRQCRECRRRNRRIRDRETGIPERNEGAGPERTAQLKAIYQASDDAQWDAVLNNLIAASNPGWEPPDPPTEGQP